MTSHSSSSSLHSFSLIDSGDDSDDDCESWHSSQSSSPSLPSPAPAPDLITIPASDHEHIHLAEVHRKLDMMKFDIPPSHPERLVVCRSFNGCNLSIINPNFDPVAFASSAENTFVKTCCKKYSSVHECRCFEWRSKSSVLYVNKSGESIHVYYLHRKTDYQNLTMSYPESYCPDEAIPPSPREDVSDSDICPWTKDYDFEEECGSAYFAKEQELEHVWSSNEAKQRYQRRQRRLEQLASGKLPKYRLVIVTFDIDELSPVTTPVHDQRRQLQKEQYIRLYESCVEEHRCRLEPAPAPATATASAPATATAPAPATAPASDPFYIIYS